MKSYLVQNPLRVISASGLLTHKPRLGFPSAFSSAIVIQRTASVFEVDVKTHTKCCWTLALGLPDCSENAGLGPCCSVYYVQEKQRGSCECFSSHWWWCEWAPLPLVTTVPPRWHPLAVTCNDRRIWHLSGNVIYHLGLGQEAGVMGLAGLFWGALTSGRPTQSFADQSEPLCSCSELS